MQKWWEFLTKKWCVGKKENPLETRKERAIMLFSEIINEEFTTVDEKKEIVAGVLVRTLPHLHLKCRPYTHIKIKEK
jgi:hypothetical protein